MHSLPFSPKMSTPDRQPVLLRGLASARDEIASRLAGLPHGRPVVGITGPVGSGKSTLAALVAGAVNGLVLSTDRYLPDYGLVPRLHRDRPDRSDLARLSHDLAALRDRGQGTIPVWSFHEHRRIGEEPLIAPGPIVCEGIFALHSAVLPHIDLRVFVEASSQTRWHRWEAIERSGERGMGIDAARRHFETIAEPTFAEFEAGYRDAADCVVLNDAEGG